MTMRDEYPTICNWTRHQAVSTTALREELQRAIDWLDAGDPNNCPSPCSEGHRYDDACAMGSAKMRERSRV